MLTFSNPGFDIGSEGRGFALFIAPILPMSWIFLPWGEELSPCLGRFI